MSKDKGSKTLQRYFIAGIAILFLALLYLFLSGHLSFNKDSWLPNFTHTSTSLSDSEPDNATTNVNTTNQQDTEKGSETISSDKSSDVSSLLNLPSLKNNSNDSNTSKQRTSEDTIYTPPDNNKGDIEEKSDSQISQEATESETASLHQTEKSNALLYKLPDGTDVKISPNTFAYKFKQAIENKTAGKPIIFDRVYFASGSEKLSKRSDVQISETAALLNTYKGINILIRGHSDNKGSSKNNSLLSLLRGGSMKKALIKLGIDRRRIQIEGVGDQEPIASNKTKRGRRKNRRIDLIIRP